MEGGARCVFRPAGKPEYDDAPSTIEPTDDDEPMDGPPYNWFGPRRFLLES